MSRSIRILAVVCLAVSSLFAASGSYRFDTWTTDNGLPQNGVRQITQTPDGYLWFTTFDGLVRFDGVRFTTFNKSNTKGIINNRFTGIFSDFDGTIYATTMEDGILTIYRDGAFSSLTSDIVPGHYIGRTERAENGEIRFLSEDDDRRGRSWYRLVNGRFEFIEKEIGATQDYTFTSRSGRKWTITASGVGEEFEGWHSFTPVDLSMVNFRRSTYEDSRGGLWIGGSQVHHISDGKLATFGEKEGLPLNSLYHSFWEESDGSVWFSSGGASTASIGLVQYIDGKIHIWGENAGLLSPSIQDIFHDREGTTWLATARGLSRRRKQVIRAFSTADGIDHSEVYPLYRDSKDNIWIGSTKGLNIYRDGVFKPVELTSPAGTAPEQAWKNGRMSVQSLYEDANGKMWVGLNGGIYLVRDGSAELLLRGSHVHAIKGDREGNVWAATNKGLLKFTDYKLAREYSTRDGLPNEFMTFVMQDAKGTMWFGGYGGLSKFENGRFVNFTKREGLVGNYIRTVYEDPEGTLWIGTYDEGMSRLKDGKFFNYREENGLYNSGVFAIEEDAKGNFWISSNRGIYRVRRQELNDLADGRIAKINSVGYGKGDGMLSNECNGGRQPASIRDKDGRFWFPTQDGVAVLDPEVDDENPLPPKVVIENVLVERESVDFRNGVAIEPGRKDLEIQYTGISLLRSDQVKFQYMLEGHDSGWIDAGNRRAANYSYLPPGSYRFIVRAANSDGVWSEGPAALSLELKPYFYQTTAFYIAAVALTCLFLFGVWRASVYHLKRREQKLTRLVEARTAELAIANENLERLANSDGLTKIGNRRRFEGFLSDEWHRAVRFKTEISLILLDIDHFKAFNDTYGHQAGDDCLQRVAEAFAETIKRPTDLVARFGGEEFAIILGGTDSAGAVMIAEEAVANLKRMEIPHASSETGSHLTVSAGVATVIAGFEGSEAELIRAADKALYQAKRNGRDRICVFDHFSGVIVEADVLSRDSLESA